MVSSLNILAPAPAVPASRIAKTITLAEGTVSAEYTPTVIYVMPIQPAAGCSYEGDRPGPEVEVTFKCGGSETQLKMVLINGAFAYRTEH